MSGITDILNTLQKENRLRSIPLPSEREMLDLSSNDYLSLAAHTDKYEEEFFDKFSDASFSSSASRLLSAKQKHHIDLETYLEALYGSPALLFNSGYHANVGAIGAISTLPSTLFLCDKLIHASMVDGLRIAGSEFRRFPHNDMGKLLKLVEKESEAFERIIIAVESIYSMDGDEAPLGELVNIKRKFPNILLYVDEAHAFGVRGAKGLGIAEEKGLLGEIDILIGTFGKAAASMGAFAVCSPELKSLLINCARPFIFSTALPPINVAWSRFMTEKIVNMTEERRHLSELSSNFKKHIEEISSRQIQSTSQIIPYHTGSAEIALSLASVLKEKGFIALPIRRPTVPPGGERIRFSLSADMEMEQLLPVFEILKNFHI